METIVDLIFMKAAQGLLLQCAFILLLRIKNESKKINGRSYKDTTKRPVVDHLFM